MGVADAVGIVAAAHVARNVARALVAGVRVSRRYLLRSLGATHCARLSTTISCWVVYYSFGLGPLALKDGCCFCYFCQQPCLYSTWRKLSDRFVFGSTWLSVQHSQRQPSMASQ